MLLVGICRTGGRIGLPEGVVGLPMPLKVYDLVNTVEMIQDRRRNARGDGGDVKRTDEQRSAKDRQIMSRQAKALLMERNHMTEDEAHKYVQKTSMESGTDMAETARMILTLLDN